MREMIILICMILSPAVAYAQPAIVFDAESKDFGKVAAGETLEHVFEFRNSGDRELIIEKLVPS
jgi:hypothetical protein